MGGDRGGVAASVESAAGQQLQEIRPQLWIPAAAMGGNSMGKNSGNGMSAESH